MPAYLHIQLFCFYNTLTALHSHIMHLYAHRILATPVNISLPENFYARSAHEVNSFFSFVVTRWVMYRHDGGKGHEEKNDERKERFRKG
ncbi:hypothetical protein VTP01DRAFT_7917 [Rhizomucor pusillus]|uniref:uncharacterized protein n=1 Tax=Rhizomucor pusillus TaxID=4840 RepID=UPI0037448816